MTALTTHIRYMALFPLLILGLCRAYFATLPSPAAAAAGCSLPSPLSLPPPQKKNPQATIGIDFLSKTMYLEDRTVRVVHGRSEKRGKGWDGMGKRGREGERGTRADTHTHTHTHRERGSLQLFWGACVCVCLCVGVGPPAIVGYGRTGAVS